MNSALEKAKAEEDFEPLSEEQRYVSVRYAARRFGVSVPSIWKWARTGKFPKPLKFGQNISRWRISDLDAWEAGQRTQTSKQ
jgi:predicted DNA-binding transcriptional regulator AlpA